MPDDPAQRQRFELKYLITEETALAMRSFVRCHLEPDEFAADHTDHSYDVHTLYLDSDELLTYRTAANGDRNRFKLRIRYYDDDPATPVFFEIKRRINETIVKQRAQVHRAAVGPLLAGESPVRAHLVSPKLQQWVDVLDFWQLGQRIAAAPRSHVAYRREAWVSSGNSSVRVTFDRQVRCGPEFGTELGLDVRDGVEVFPSDVILELKFTDRLPGWLGELIRTFDLVRCGSAKYVMGVYLLGEMKVARRRTGFAWGMAEMASATSSPWLDSAAAVRGALAAGKPL